MQLNLVGRILSLYNLAVTCLFSNRCVVWLITGLGVDFASYDIRVGKIVLWFVGFIPPQKIFICRG